MTVGLLYIPGLQKPRECDFCTLSSFNCLPCVWCMGCGEPGPTVLGNACVLPQPVKWSRSSLQARTEKDRHIPRIMWQPPSSSYLRSLEALCCFLESVASFTSSDQSIWSPRHRYMLSDVLIVCHFKLSALESLVYAVTCANTLPSLGTLRRSAKLPTILLDRLCVCHFPIILQSPYHHCLLFLAFLCLLHPFSSFCNEDVPSLKDPYRSHLPGVFHAWPSFNFLSHPWYWASHI